MKQEVRKNKLSVGKTFDKQNKFPLINKLLDKLQLNEGINTHFLCLTHTHKQTQVILWTYRVLWDCLKVITEDQGYEKKPNNNKKQRYTHT